MNIHATRKRNIFDPAGTGPFPLSRSKIELSLSCQRCFYLDLRLGVGRPRSFPFNLNNAVDLLLKKECDRYREKGEAHPLAGKNGLALVPMRHERLSDWRDPFTGVRQVHEESGFEVFGGIDDVWTDADGAVYVVDYKATSKEGEVTLDAEWQRSYKNQVEIYQWLFRRNGFTVSDTAYFIYANGDRSADGFADVLRFATKLLPYTGSADWVDGALVRARDILRSDSIPAAGTSCDYCPYREAAGKSFRHHITGK